MGIYVPLSQCTTNLYAQQGEFFFFGTGEEYIGPYWEYINGFTFVGATPQSLPKPIRIIRTTFGYPDASMAGQFKNTFSQVALGGHDADISFASDFTDWDPTANKNYNSLRSAPIKNLGFNPEIKTVPSHLSPPPTQKDYEAYEFTRFFVKKRNENLFYETSKDYFNPMRAEDKDYYWELYQVFPLKWRITGNLENVKTINVNMVHLAERKHKIPYFHLYIKDYLKYYGGDLTPAPEINGDPITPPVFGKFNIPFKRNTSQIGGLGY